MDPNRFVERMLDHMQTATSHAREGDFESARLEWQEVADNLDDLNEHLNRRGFPPTTLFNYEIEILN